MGFIQLIVYALLGKDITVLGPHQVLDENILWQYFLHDAFNLGVRQRTKKFILHKILEFYPRIDFINKGLSIVPKMHV